MTIELDSLAGRLNDPPTARMRSIGTNGGQQLIVQDHISSLRENGNVDECREEPCQTILIKEKKRQSTDFESKGTGGVSPKAFHSGESRVVHSSSELCGVRSSSLPHELHGGFDVSRKMLATIESSFEEDTSSLLRAPGSREAARARAHTLRGTGGLEGVRRLKGLGREEMPMSRAATEAWTAAEIWALTMATATAVAAVAGSAVDYEPLWDATCDGAEKEAMLELTKSEQHMHRTSRSVVHATAGELHADKAYCARSDAKANGVHDCAGKRNGGENISSPQNSPSSRRYPLRTAGSLRLRSRNEVSVVPSNIAVDAPLKRTLLADGEQRAAAASLGVDFGIKVPIGGAAAVALRRIHHGELMWRRKVQRTVLTTLISRCREVREQNAQQFTALRHWERVRLWFGFRCLQAWRSHKKYRESRSAGHRSAILPASTIGITHTVTRRRRICRGVAMLRR